MIVLLQLGLTCTLKVLFSEIYLDTSSEEKFGEIFL
jgi:hypothetical protein